MSGEKAVIRTSIRKNKTITDRIISVMERVPGSFFIFSGSGKRGGFRISEIKRSTRPGMRTVITVTG